MSPSSTADATAPVDARAQTPRAPGAPGETPAPPAPPADASGGRPLRVTFLLKRADLSGGCRVVRIYAEALAARGHSVRIVSCPDPPERLRSRVKRALTGGGLAARPRTVENQIDGSTVPHAVVRGHQGPEPGELPDADVLIATWWETAEWVHRMPERKGRPLFFVQHDERVFSEASPEQRQKVEQAWRLGMPAVVVAAWIGEEMRKHGVPADRIALVPNAVDAERFRAEPRGKQPEPTVGLMLAWVHFKGVDVAIEAIRIARETLPGLRVKAFGHADPKDCVLEAPAGMQYRRQPPQDQIREVYAGCDAWLFASRCEGFGLPILEAMACRTPVIGTPAGAAPELLGPRADGPPAGVLVPMEDPRAMAEAILRVVGMPDPEWRALSGRAHEVATGYTWEQASDLFEAQVRKAAAV